MRHLILLLAALPTLTASAVEGNDTTFTVDNKKIIVSTEKGKTNLQVYDIEGNKQTKSREVEFIDGQEIEHVYVTSPFIPQSIGKKNRQLKSHYPFFYIGFNQIPGSIMGSGGNPEMHTRGSKSWEWGITLTSAAFRLTNSIALTSAVSIGKVHNHFQGNYVLTTQNGITSMRQEGESDLRKTYISYGVARLPIMLEWQRGTRQGDLFIAAGASVEMRWNDHSRYRIGKKKYTETGDINLNPMGLNLEMRIGYGFLMIYGRAALTPLLKTKFAPECYPVSFGVGFRF